MCIAGLFCPSVLIPGLSLSFRSSSLSDCMAASCRPSPRGGKAKDEAKLFSYFSRQNKAMVTTTSSLWHFNVEKLQQQKCVKSRAPVGVLFSTSTGEMRPRSARSMLGQATGASDWAEGGASKATQMGTLVTGFGRLFTASFNKGFEHVTKHQSQN